MSNIAAALVKARKAFGPALKTKSNPHLKSNYADLSACLEAVEDALTDAGIWLYQETSECQSGVTVETVFLHASGESLRCGKLHVPAIKMDPQGYGSALTYARRYSLMTACGIAAEDDDGNDASKPRFTSAPRAIFDELPKDWQDYLRSLAPKVENAFEQLGAAAAAEMIAKEALEGEVRAGLESLLGSKTRSALKKLAA
jgi:hypothetical protein